jgi:hypothetical protein
MEGIYICTLYYLVLLAYFHEEILAHHLVEHYIYYTETEAAMRCAVTSLIFSLLIGH